MKKLDLDGLVVSTFETQAPFAEPEAYAAMDRTPDTYCFACGNSGDSCNSFCLPQTDGGGA